MTPTDPRPAQRQEAETIANLFAEVKAAEHRFELAGREALDAAARAGRTLLRLRELCPAGQWLALLEKYWPGSRYKAARYMRLAEPRNWNKVKKCLTIADALAMLAQRVTPEVEKEDLFRTDTSDECGAGATSTPQVDEEQGDEEIPVSGETDPGLAEVRREFADAARGRALVEQAMRHFLKGREALSEAYQTAVREKMEVAALRASSLLALKPTDGFIRHGTTETGIDHGIPLMTNEAMNLLLQMVAGTKMMTEEPEDEPEEPEPEGDDE